MIKNPKKDYPEFHEKTKKKNDTKEEAHRLKNWKELPIGGTIEEAGNSKHYSTGEWRSRRPVFFPEKCKQCMICWPVCPDAAILAEDGSIIGIDYEHCKGCGICAEECPFGALEMHNESEFEDDKEIIKHIDEPEGLRES